MRQAARLDSRNKIEAPEFDKHLAKAREIRVEVWRQELMASLLRRLLSRMSHDMKILLNESESLNPDDPERARKLVRQMEVFFQGHADAAAYFLGHFRPVREDLLKRPPSAPA